MRSILPFLLSLVLATASGRAAGQSDFVYSTPGLSRAAIGADNGDILAADGNTLYRLDANGGLIWAGSYTAFERIRGVLELSGGDLIVAGSMTDANGTVLGLMRTTSGGTPVWCSAITTDVVPDAFGLDFSTTLRRAGANGFVLYDTYGSDRRLSLFTGSGGVVWSRLYINGNFLKGIAVDEAHGKLFATDGSDLYRYDLSDGHEIWQRGLGVTGTAVTIACNGDRLGVGYTGPGADAAIAVLDTAGNLLGAREWDDPWTTQGNNRIVARGNGFTLASGTFAPGGFFTILCSVDAALTTSHVVRLPDETLHLEMGITAADGVLLSGEFLLAQVDPLGQGGCIDTLAWTPFDPGLSGASTSACVYSPSAPFLDQRAPGPQSGSVLLTPVCQATAVQATGRTELRLLVDPGAEGLRVLHPPGTATLRLFDARGALVLSVPADRSGSSLLGTRGLVNGVYGIAAEDGAGRLIGTVRCAVAR